MKLYDNTNKFIHSLPHQEIVKIPKYYYYEHIRLLKRFNVLFIFNFLWFRLYRNNCF
jgi:hypothetical protein